MPPCLPSALDFIALPPSTSSPHSDGHLLVLEVQNVSAVACVLQGPSIELLPRSDDGNNILGTSYADEPEDALGTKPLAPGEWAICSSYGWIGLLRSAVRRVLDCAAQLLQRPSEANA